MQYSLPSGVHHAIADGRNIFLDVGRDRYFALPESLDRAFTRHSSKQHLDRRDHDALLRLVSQGLLTEGHAPQYERTVVPVGAKTVLDNNLAEPIEICLLARAVTGIVTAKHLHRKFTLTGILRHIEAHPAPCGNPSELTELRRFAIAFRRASFLTRARDECLPRSTALAICLRRSGIAARLVMGVSGRPFAAHCWVQVDDVIVNDALDHVANFTPILAL